MEPRKFCRTRPRSWRLQIALMADRSERRIGDRLTDDEVDRLSLASDPLVLRQLWFRYGGYLVVEAGRLRLSRDLRRRQQPS